MLSFGMGRIGMGYAVSQSQSRAMITILINDASGIDTNSTELRYGLCCMAE